MKVSIHSLYPSQLERYRAVTADHPEAIVLKCRDEFSGIRFGQSKARIGKCIKIGSGGRNPGQTGYQLWASWAETDIRSYSK